MELDLIKAIAEGQGRAALATIMDVKGSAPRHPGSKLLLGADGAFLGTVGGGLGESRALAAGRDCLASGRSTVIQVEMLGEDITATDLVCGGTNTMLVECLDDRAPYRLALERLARGERVLLVKRLAGADPLRVAVALLDEAGRPIAGAAEGWAEAPAAKALATGQARFDEAAGLLYDPLLPEEKLVILGGGHVGQALACAAPALGFRVTVVDDRPEFLTPDRFPAGVATRQGEFTQVIRDFPFDSATYAVIVTRGHRFDLACAREVLRRRFRYAGLMGSARKTRLLHEQLLQDGVDPAKVDSLCAPIGLDIAAETPAELAVAILGELVAVRRNAKALAAMHAARAARRGGAPA